MLKESLGNKNVIWTFLLKFTISHFNAHNHSLLMVVQGFSLKIGESEKRENEADQEKIVHYWQQSFKKETVPSTALTAKNNISICGIYSLKGW